MAAGLTVGAEAKRDGAVRDGRGGLSLAENIMGEGLNGRVGGGGVGVGESWRQWLGRWWGAAVRPGVRRRWGGGGRDPYHVAAATHMHGGYRYRPEPRPAPPLLPRDSCRCCPCG